MHADYQAAFGTDPLYILFGYKFSYTQFLYAQQIFNHAQAIVRPVAIIQMTQTVTRKLLAIIAELPSAFYFLATILDWAGNTKFCLECVVSQATRTRLSLSLKCPA